MELSTVYSTLGSKVVIVDALDSVQAAAYADPVRPVKRHAETHFKEIRVKTKVSKMATSGKHIQVTFDGEGAQRVELYDRVLVSVRRVPNCADLGLENTKVVRDERGFIKVN